MREEVTTQPTRLGGGIVVTAAEVSRTMLDELRLMLQILHSIASDLALYGGGVTLQLQAP